MHFYLNLIHHYFIFPSHLFSNIFFQLRFLFAFFLHLFSQLFHNVDQLVVREVRGVVEAAFF